MTMIEVIIGANVLVLVAGVLVLARLASRVGRAADDVGLVARRLAELTPAAHALIESGREELESLRLLTRATTAVANDLRAVSGQASAVTSHLARGFESEVFDRYRAVFAGARAGLGMLRRFRGSNGSHDSRSMEMDEFEPMYEKESHRREPDYGKQ
jgi:hypothetical protein